MQGKKGSLIICLILTWLCFGPISVLAQEDNSPAMKELRFFAEIFARVRAQYVKVPDDKQLIESAVAGMLSSLDPHSSYLTPEAMADIKVLTKGSFGGLGIEVKKKGPYVAVADVMEDTPAARAGLAAEDEILKVDGVDVVNQPLFEVVKQMRGPAGAAVTLTLKRRGLDKPKIVTLVREEIKVKAVKWHIAKDIGYIRLLQFSEQTYDGLMRAIFAIKEKLPKDKLKGYVLDLRVNPGGLLDQAVKVAAVFLNGGEIVSTRGRDPKRDLHFDARGRDQLDGKPLIVLINGGSASASEIVSGALQDHCRALILGTRSFGKGSVQTLIPLDNKGALRLTTSLYYTPSGKSIQGHGIEPDINVVQPLPKNLQKYKMSIGESELPGHIKGQAEDKAGSGSNAYVPERESEDVQLQRAYKILRSNQYKRDYNKLSCRTKKPQRSAASAQTLPKVAALAQAQGYLAMDF